MFDGAYYLQKHGTAVSARMAPSYMNAFMEKLKSDLLQQAEKKPMVWWKYIDDIFAIWAH